MEIDIGKERGEHRALWRTDLCGLNQPVFHDTSLQHPADQAKNTVVSDPLPQKLQQPLVMHRVEKPAYVGLDEVIHTLLLEGPTQCIQTLVRTPLGPVAVATFFDLGLKQRF